MMWMRDDEDEEHEALRKNLSPKSRKNRVFMVISILFIFLALAILSFFVFFNKRPDTVLVIPQSRSLIFADHTDFKAIDGFSKDQIIETVSNQASAAPVDKGGVEGIYLTESNKVLGFESFIAHIRGNLTTDQTSVIGDNFLIGALNNGTDNGSSPANNLFMLFKVSSFFDIFPVMQSWESKMFYDLHGFFGIKTSADNNYLFTKDFEDGIVANKNARILYDNNRQIVLMYVFIDDTSIVITNSEAATREVITRLTSSQIRK